MYEETPMYKTGLHAEIKAHRTEELVETQLIYIQHTERAVSVARVQPRGLTQRHRLTQRVLCFGVSRYPLVLVPVLECHVFP